MPKAVKTPPKKVAKKAAVKKTPKAASSGPVLINFVLDKSGSMRTCLSDTIGGFNTYIEKLKADKKTEYLFSLTLFDTKFENRHVAVPLANVPELTEKTYVPGGMTALLDAVGTTVAAVEAKGEKVGKVLTVILTDGQENSSREYGRDAIKALIERKEKEGNWTFVFLGAGLDAFAAGDAIGVRHANSVAYDPQNVKGVYANMAHATMSFSSGAAASTGNLLRSVGQRGLRAAGMSQRAPKAGKTPFGAGATPKH